MVDQAFQIRHAAVNQKIIYHLLVRRAGSPLDIKWHMITNPENADQAVVTVRPGSLQTVLHEFQQVDMIFWTATQSSQTIDRVESETIRLLPFRDWVWIITGVSTSWNMFWAFFMYQLCMGQMIGGQLVRESQAQEFDAGQALILQGIVWIWINLFTYVYFLSLNFVDYR